MQSLCNTVQPYFLKAGFNPNREASVYVVFFSRWLNIASIWKKSAMRYFFGNDPAWNENTSSRKEGTQMVWPLLCDHWPGLVWLNKKVDRWLIRMRYLMVSENGRKWKKTTRDFVVFMFLDTFRKWKKMEENNKGFCRFHVSRHFPKMEENNKGLRT